MKEIVKVADKGQLDAQCMVDVCLGVLAYAHVPIPYLHVQ